MLSAPEAGKHAEVSRPVLHALPQPEQHRLKNFALNPCDRYDLAHLTCGASRITRLSTRTDRGQPGPEVRDESLCLSQDEDLMATRDENTDQNRAADEAARTARTVTDEAARVGEQTARGGADMAR